MMRLLIDTNIFIYRENYHVIPSNLQSLLKILNDLAVQILVHPLSVREIERDKNHERRKIVSSKIKTYLLLDDPPRPETDQHFLSLVGQANNLYEVVDNSLLYCVYKNAVDFLLTEDGAIRRKSERLGISDRVFGTDEAVEYFKKQLVVEKVPKPPALNYVPAHNLDINDPIFSSLKEEYPNFIEWWEKISREGRKAWVYYFKDKILGAILIYKIENEPIASSPPLPRKRRLKICTFNVTYRGYKIGELFVKISIEFAIGNNIDELYLMHFTKPDDYLVELIDDFGFHKTAEQNGQDVFIKRLVPDARTKGPAEISRKFYPSFYDGETTRKFIVPIRPEYHTRLFTDYQPRQPTIFEFGGELIIEGNTIKKAYLCHSITKNMSQGDILLFYRSVDERRITTLGVIEQVYHGATRPGEIIRYVGKRSVYSREEIEGMARKPTKVILFRQHFHLRNPLTLNYLKRNNIVRGAPQSIVRIPHEKYLMIRSDGGIDERFTVG